MESAFVPRSGPGPDRGALRGKGRGFKNLQLREKFKNLKTLEIPLLSWFFTMGEYDAFPTLREPFQSPAGLSWTLKGRKRPKRAFFGPSKAHFGCFQCFWGLFCLFSGLSDSAKLFLGPPLFPVLKKKALKKNQFFF